MDRHGIDDFNIEYMVTPEQKLEATIKMYRHYLQQAVRCFDIYPDIVDAYFMYDYNMERAAIYELSILQQIN